MEYSGAFSEGTESRESFSDTSDVCDDVYDSTVGETEFSFEGGSSDDESWEVSGHYSEVETPYEMVEPSKMDDATDWPVEAQFDDYDVEPVAESSLCPEDVPETFQDNDLHRDTGISDDTRRDIGEGFGRDGLTGKNPPEGYSDITLTYPPVEADFDAYTEEAINDDASDIEMNAESIPREADGINKTFEGFPTGQSTDEVPYIEDSQEDFTESGNTPEERALLEEMYESGELEPTTIEESEIPSEPGEHNPKNAGVFEGEPGESIFLPNDDKAREVLQKYGKGGVEYRNGDPDFTPFAQQDSPWGWRGSTVVEIPHMTDQRENPKLEDGRRPRGTSHDPRYDLGNFAQADNELRDVINKAIKPRTVTSEQIVAWRKKEKLTWHEVDDGKTMMLVPSALHDKCPHSGGVSFMKMAQAYGNYNPE